VRWYEIRSPATTPVIFQQSTYAPDSNYRWMGSIAMDMQGNMALGYSVASSTLVPAIRYTGRLAGDPAGMMQAETSIIEGSGAQGAQTGPGLDRWGDYSAMTIDPVDDCTFWYTNQYQKTTGTYNWSTRIATLAFPGCNAAKQAQTASFTSTAPVGTVFGAGSYTVTATATSGLPVALSIDAAASAICHLDGSASGSHVTFTGAGTCVVDANQQGDITYQPAPQAQQSFAIAKAAQTIAFNTIAPAPAVAGGATYQVLATATSALPVVLSVDASATSICTLDGSTTGSHVSFIHAGTCAINANQAGNANYGAAAQMQQSLNVVPGPPAALVFTTQPPAQIATGATLPTIAVSEQDSVGDVLDDNNSLVGFTIVACGASVNLGSATMLHGVATLNAPQRFFGTGSYQVTATSVALIGVSSAFSVVDNGGVVFANGYENCTL